MVGRDAAIVRIQTMCVNSVDDSLVTVSTSQLSHGRPHIFDVGLALELAQTTPVVPHDIFAYALCQCSRLLYSSSSQQALLAT